MNLKLVTAATFTAASLSATTVLADGHTACGEVSITQMDWASAAVVTSVATFLMSEGYGCDVTVVPTTTVPAITSVAETGEPDIITELWTSYTEVYDELVGEGKIVEMSSVLSWINRLI